MTSTDYDVYDTDTDAMAQGTHIDVSESLDPLAVECDCGETVTGATAAATIDAWELHIQQD